jgi:hypothetical protein
MHYIIFCVHTQGASAMMGEPGSGVQPASTGHTKAATSPNDGEATAGIIAEEQVQPA